MKFTSKQEAKGQNKLRLNKFTEISYLNIGCLRFRLLDSVSS